MVVHSERLSMKNQNLAFSRCLTLPLVTLNNYVWLETNLPMQLNQSCSWTFFGLIWVILHCVKSVQIRSFFWSVFFHIQAKYGKIRTRKNSVFGHFSCGVGVYVSIHFFSYDYCDLFLNSKIQYSNIPSIWR